MSTKTLLIDNLGSPIRLTLAESADGKKMVARGEFARAGVATENRRVYPRSLWERELNHLRDDIAARKVFGELDHPNDGRTKLSRTSHIITSLELEGDVVIGEAEILDTDSGRNLQAILRGGGAVGVSSRGYGTTQPGPNGEDIVQDDYRLMTFDFVAEPANTTSYPTISVEHKETRGNPRVQESEDMDLTKLTAEDVKKHNPALYESIYAAAKQIAESDIESLKAKMKQELLGSLSDVRKQAFEEAKAAVLSDPELATARVAMEQVKKALGLVTLPEDVQKVVSERDERISSLQTKLAESDLRIKGLEEQLGKLCDVAREAAYKYHLEGKLAGNPRANVIRKLIGDVRAFENVQAIDAKIEAVESEIKATIKAEEVEKSKYKALMEENAKLKQSTQDALKLAREMGVALYIENKVKGHPQAAKIKALIESKNLSNKEQVDAAYATIASKLSPPRSDEEVERIRRRLGRARESLMSESNEGTAAQPRSELAEDFSRLDNDLNYVRALAGIK